MPFFPDPQPFQQLGRLSFRRIAPFHFDDLFQLDKRLAIVVVKLIF